MWMNWAIKLLPWPATLFSSARLCASLTSLPSIHLVIHSLIHPSSSASSFPSLFCINSHNRSFIVTTWRRSADWTLQFKMRHWYHHPFTFFGKNDSSYKQVDQDTDTSPIHDYRTNPTTFPSSVLVAVWKLAVHATSWSTKAKSSCLMPVFIQPMKGLPVYHSTTNSTSVLWIFYSSLSMSTTHTTAKVPIYWSLIIFRKLYKIHYTAFLLLHSTIGLVWSSLKLMTLCSKT